MIDRLNPSIESNGDRFRSIDVSHSIRTDFFRLNNNGADFFRCEGIFSHEFYSDFFFYVNVLGVILQLFAVSRILKYMGVRMALLILPLTALVGNLLVVALPVLAYLRWTKTFENATDYSLQNTVRNVLFLPCTREEKYNAKQAIDTFFVRTGDVFSALLVYAGIHAFQLSVQGFALANVVLIGLWIAVALAIGKLYQNLAGRA